MSSLSLPAKLVTASPLLATVAYVSLVVNTLGVNMPVGTRRLLFGGATTVFLGLYVSFAGTCK